MKSDFANAEDYYNQSYIMHLLNADYALFQKALAEGVQKKYKEKIADLKLFINNYGSSNSSLNQKARFELALAYYQNKQNDVALEAFKKFVVDFPNSIYESPCLSKIGLIYYNNKDDHCYKNNVNR